MADLVSYLVARAHLGDLVAEDGVKGHHYEEGDTRDADPVVVAQLVKNGVLIDPNAKAEAGAEENKAEAGAPENKASPKPALVKAPKPAKSQGT